jgi:2-polyprenyl-6-methoxyphenol hydroxylase-like FAD-dependent oxidoreductase
LALARRGWPVSVIEGAPEFGAIGFGIQFGPNVLHALDHIGVSGAVLEKADTPPALLMIDALNGEEVTRVATGVPAFRARFKYPYSIIHRIDLHNVLLDACRRDPLITLVGDAMVTRYYESGDSVTVETEDGRSFQAALLVGADGIRSRMRAQMLADGDPLPNGSRPSAPSCQWATSLPTFSATLLRYGEARAFILSIIRCATARCSTLPRCSVDRPVPSAAMLRLTAPSLNRLTVTHIPP